MNIIKPTRGVVYLAIDAWSYLELAVISAFALHQVSPDLEIVILSNLDCPQLRSQLAKINIFIKSIVVPEEERRDNAMVSRWTKISLNNLNLFDETLYLDSDVIPVQPIDAIWNFVKLADLLISPDCHPQVSECKHISQPEIDYTLTICAPNAIQYNGGVILWKKSPQTQTLFDTWQQEWRVFKQQDQLALCRAIQKTQVAIGSLPRQYNYPLDLLTDSWPLDLSQIEWEMLRENDIKIVHSYHSVTGKWDIFHQAAKKFMPDSTEKALRYLRSYLPQKKTPLN